jgi:N-acetylneuraminic acid mutarotase/glucose/arabinose dehydrogenase
VTSVPGILAHYYDATGIGASALLDQVPARASFAERRSDLSIPAGISVGGSSYTRDVMVQLVGAFTASQSAEYEFVTQGGVDHRILVDGQPYVGGTLVLGVGAHSLELRFAVDTLADLPLDVDVIVDTQPRPDFAASMTHDERTELPLIHDMPAEGNESGGNLIVLKGFGLFPRDQVVVHWGSAPDSPNILPSEFLKWSDQELQFQSPPSPGPPGVTTVITVVVETPNGQSNARAFTYSHDGDVPIVFNPAPPIAIGPATTGDWGPDGRFYVGTIKGEIKAITFDDSYGVVGVATYPGVSQLGSHMILGLAFDPYDAGDPVTLYVSHSQLFAQGGGSFTGVSPYPGMVSILRGPSFDAPETIISRLPTSNHDHAVNGLQFDDNGDLLIAMGGNTNAGVKDPDLGDLPESPLSGAILKAELSRPDFNGDLHYVETETGIENDDQVFGETVDLAPGTHVTVYAPGIRNPYDLLYTTWRMLYATDNGPNSSFGRASTGPDSDAPDPFTSNDEICLIEYKNYYGHPNRCRGRTDFRQYIYRGETDASIAGEFVQMIGSSPSSTDGIAEYRAACFDGQMRGDLIVQKYGGTWRRVKLSADHRRVASIVEMPLVGALDIQTGPGGALLALDYNGSSVKVLIPGDASPPGLTVYDITPWRAPVTGGQTFVIGGRGFGTLDNTTVKIGELPATLLSVSATRIVGIVPEGLSPTMALLDVTVKVDLEENTLTSAFRALPAQPGQAPGFWVEGVSPPDALGEVAGGVVGPKLYLVGEGASGTRTYAYDLLGDFWTSSAAPRPFPGDHHSAEVVAGKLYLIGGLDAGSDGKVQIFNPDQGANGAWTAGADMPWDGGSVSTALIGNKIYAAGGIVGSDTVANAAVYDPVSNSWTAIAPMPTKVNHAAAATDGQKLYIFGGRQGGNSPQPGFKNVQIYDPATDTWEDSGQPGSSISEMPSGRGGTGRAVYYKGEFYVFGGETSDSDDPEATPGRVFAQVQVYNPVRNTWRQEAHMPTARHGIWPLLFQSRIHVIAGGVHFGNSQSTVHEIFTRQ